MPGSTVPEPTRNRNPKRGYARDLETEDGSQRPVYGPGRFEQRPSDESARQVQDRHQELVSKQAFGAAPPDDVRGRQCAANVPIQIECRQYCDRVYGRVRALLGNLVCTPYRRLCLRIDPSIRGIAFGQTREHNFFSSAEASPAERSGVG
jgi:hypothetical protein